MSKTVVTAKLKQEREGAVENLKRYYPYLSPGCYFINKLEQDFYLCEYWGKCHTNKLTKFKYLLSKKYNVSTEDLQTHLFNLVMDSVIRLDAVAREGVSHQN